MKGEDELLEILPWIVFTIVMIWAIIITGSRK
jgi:hypothetical protein